MGRTSSQILLTGKLFRIHSCVSFFIDFNKNYNRF